MSLRLWMPKKEDQSEEETAVEKALSHLYWGMKDLIQKKSRFEGPIRINSKVKERIEEALQKWIYSPPQAIRNSLQWVQHPLLKNIAENTPEFTGAIDTWEITLYHWTFVDFKRFYSTSRFYFFQPLAKYHPVSITYVEKWVENQCKLGSITDGCNNSQQTYLLTIKDYLQAISDVVHRRINKLNCLHFVGEKNAGNTWFTNIFLDFYINRGDLENWNRYVNASFPFMNLPNRRIALWNEACITEDLCQLEQIKILSEGACTTVAVKHKKPGLLPCF